MADGRFRWVYRVMGLGCAGLVLALLGCGRPSAATLDDLEVPAGVVARVVVFEAADCIRCGELYDVLLAPLQARCGPSLEVKRVPIDTPEGYEAFVATEELLIGEAGRWDVPTVVIEDTYFTGESTITQELVPHLECVFQAGGNVWPRVPALDPIAPVTPPSPVAGAVNPFGAGGGDDELCLSDEEDGAICAMPEPLSVLYFAETSCGDRCSRTRYDLRYLQGVYPQLIVDERDISGDRALADAVWERLGIQESVGAATQAVIVGNDYLVGDDVTLDALRQLLATYAEDGASAFWLSLK